MQTRLLSVIRAFAKNKASASLPLVTGGGWEQAVFQEYNCRTYNISPAVNLGPSRFLLDEALKGTALANVPVILYASDLHCAWYNSAAIELARGKSFDIDGRITQDTGSDSITRVPQTLTGEYHGVDFSRYRGQPWSVFREGAARYMDTCLPPAARRAETAADGSSLKELYPRDALLWCDSAAGYPPYALDRQSPGRYSISGAESRARTHTVASIPARQCKRPRPEDIRRMARLNIVASLNSY